MPYPGKKSYKLQVTHACNVQTLVFNMTNVFFADGLFCFLEKTLSFRNNKNAMLHVIMSLLVSAGGEGKGGLGG